MFMPWWKCLEVLHGVMLAEAGPGERGHKKHMINYRHVIDWLVRKPGAFVAYRHRDAMFPTGRFRRAYDILLAQVPARAAKDYLRILESAAKESEAGVNAILGRLLDLECADYPDRRRGAPGSRPGTARAMEVVVTTVDLSLYDTLLETGEDLSLASQSMCMNP